MGIAKIVPPLYRSEKVTFFSLARHPESLSVSESILDDKPNYAGDMFPDYKSKSSDRKAEWE